MTDIEQKAKEYADSFFEDEPFGILYEECKNDFKAGFEAGSAANQKDMLDLQIGLARMKGEFIGTLKALRYYVTEPTVLKNIQEKLSELEQEKK